MTPEEMHAKHAFPLNAKCQACGSQQVIMRAITFGPYSEVANDNGLAPLVNGAPPTELFKRIVQFRGPDGKPRPYVRLGVAYSCKQCGPSFERSLAHLPSWVEVEFNRGPGPEKPLVQVAR
jgi:hypothetical protein